MNNENINQEAVTTAVELEKIEKKHIPAIILAVVCIIVAVLCSIKAVKEIKYRELLPDSPIIELEGTLIIADGGNGTEIPKNTFYAIDDLRTKQFTAMKIDARLIQPFEKTFFEACLP